VLWAQQQSWADAQRVVVMGPSHGGLATLAYGEQAAAGTRLLVNVSGGLRLAHCEGWQDGLVEAMASMAEAAREAPTLWIYGENDSHFGPAIWRTAHQRYVALGGQAELAAIGPFGDDAHLLFSSREGVPRWLPQVLQQMAARGLPTAVQPRFDALLDMPHTPLEHTASAAEIKRWPQWGTAARRAYIHWLDARSPKAFAISEDGRHWSSVWGMVRPGGRALDQCQREARGRCRLFAVDGYLVSGGE
jgi:hypothetical protein